MITLGRNYDLFGTPGPYSVTTNLFFTNAHIFCFLYHFLSFSRELLIQRKLHAMQNFYFKTFVLAAKAL